MDYNHAAKSLRWLANQFPAIEHPKDDTDKIVSCINMYCENGANAITNLLARAEAAEARVLDLETAHRTEMCEDGYDCVELGKVRAELAAAKARLGGDYDLDRLRELIEADREGRCVVLPCRVGDVVYQTNGVELYQSEVKKIVYDAGWFAFDESAIGTSVYLTPEAAEAALKGGAL